ncbi:melanopsin-like [Hyalella azteca]|uniref:Melanopsin-like n=1 Tax=Hyalella azteca TaxID=294128 RepID=A0A8B7PI04_HYAAZ|nr:melanopsin-like [Hyalella azteca]
MFKERFSEPVLIVASVAISGIAVLGTMGNLLAVVALLRSTKLRRSSTYYIVNLAFSNLPVCIIAMPLYAVVLVQALCLDEVLVPPLVLHAIAVIGFIGNQAELHTICVLSFNRVLAMFKPRAYQKLVQLRVYRYVLAGLWLYSVGMWVPPAFGWLGELEISEQDLFVIISRKSKIARRLFLFFAFTLPLLFSLVCHLMLLCKGLRAGVESSSQQQWRQQITKTVSLVFLLLLVLSVPHIVVHALQARGHSEPKSWLLVHVLFFGR